MRFATLKPPLPGKVEVSVVTITGSAGGELPNVNRWRAQLGPAPIEDPALPSLHKLVQSKAGPIFVFDFSGGGDRIVVGLLPTTDGNTWFFKLAGNDAPVGQAKPDFMKLLGTLNLG
jgi:hypothetical protein